MTALILRLIGEADTVTVCLLRVLVRLCQAVLISRTLMLLNGEHPVHCTESVNVVIAQTMCSLSCNPAS